MTQVKVVAQFCDGYGCRYYYYIVILLGEDLSQQALNIVEGVVLNPNGLLLSFHTSPEVASSPLVMLTDTKPVWTELMVPEEA